MTRRRNDLSLAAAATRVIKIKRRQSRYEKPIHALWELFSDYSETSTVHGIRYLGEKKRHWSERVWWMIAFTISIVACAAFIYQAWIKWSDSPVIVTFAEESTPVYKIPFPSVTVCADTKSKQRILNYTDVYYKLRDPLHKANITNDILHLTQSVAQICHTTSDEITDLGDDVTYRNIYNDLKRVSPTLRETFTNCEWKTTKTPCRLLFKETLTDEGICFTFNLLNASEIYREEMLAKNFTTLLTHEMSSAFWSPDNNAEYTNEDLIYPRRVLSASEGLVINLRLFTNDTDFLCGGPVQSFKILLHTNGEVPQMSKYYYRVPLDHDIVMSVRPSLMETTETLIKNYNYVRRKCFYDGERQLEFFRKYTQRNCQLDCVARRTVEICKCAKFTMPRHETTPVCGLQKLRCVNRVENEYAVRIMTKKANDCNCLPACESVSYDAELSMAKYDRYEFLVAKNKVERSNNRKHLRIFISFKDEQFFGSRRSEIYGKTDFIANCGGIMGLFMGVSLLSIVEMVYFSTLRLGCNLRKRRIIKQQRLKIQRELDALASNTNNDDTNNRFSKISFDDANSMSNNTTDNYRENCF